MLQDKIPGTKSPDVDKQFRNTGDFVQGDFVRFPKAMELSSTVTQSIRALKRLKDQLNK